MAWSLYYQGRSYWSGWSGLPLCPDHYIIRAGATGQAGQAYRYDLITILSGPELPVRLVRLTAMTWSLYYQGRSYRSGWSGLPLWPDHYIIRAGATGQAGQAYRYDLITILSGPELPVRLVRLTAMTWSLYYQGWSYRSGWSGLPLWPDHYIIRAGATGQAGQAYRYDLITILSGPELPVRLVRLTAMTWSLYYQGRSYRSGWSGLPLWPDHYIIRAGATGQAGQAYRHDLITILSGPELPVRLVRLTAMTWSLYYQGRSYRSGWSGLPLWPDHYIIRAGATRQAGQAYRYDLITILSGPELPVRLVRLTAMTWPLYYHGRSYRSGWSGLPLWPDHYIIRAGATGQAGQAYRYDLITILSGPELPVRLVRLTAMTWSLYYQGRSYPSGWSGLPLWPDHYIIRAGATGQAGQAYRYDLITILSGPELPVRLIRLTAMTWSLYYQGRSYRSGWSGLPLWPDHYIIRAGATRQAGQAYRYDLTTILSGPELPVRLVRLTTMTWSLYYQGRSYRSGWSGLPLWPDHYIIRAGATGQAGQAYRYDLITILSGPELPVRLVRLTAMTWSLYYQGRSYRSGWSGLPLWPDHYIIRAGATGQADQAYRYDLITILSGPELPVRLVRLTAMTWSLYYQGLSYRSGWSGLPLWPDHYIIRAEATGQAGQAYRYDLITILSGPELPVRMVRLTAMTWSLYYQGRSYPSGWLGLPLWPYHYIIRAGATGQAGQAYHYDLITILSGPELPVRLVRLTAMTWSLYYQGRSYRSGWSGLPLWPDHYIIRAGATGQAGQAYRYDLITILSGPELPVRLIRLTAMTWSLYYQGRSYRSGWSGLPLWPDHYIIRAGATGQAGQAYRYDLITILSGPELPVMLVRLTAMTWSLYYQGRSYRSGWSGLPLCPDHYIIRAGATGQAGQANRYDLITILSGPKLPVRLDRLTAMTWSLYYQGRSYRSGWSGLPLWPDHYIIRAEATGQAGQAYHYGLTTILSGPELPVRLVRLTAMTWSLYYQGRSYRSDWSGLPLWPDHYIIRAGATGQAGQAYRYDLITILSGPELPVRLVRLTAMTWSLYYQGRSYRSGWSGLPLWPDHYIIRAGATGQAGQAYRYDLITILSGPELPVRLVRLTAMTWSLYYQGRSYPSGWSGLVRLVRLTAMTWSLYYQGRSYRPGWSGLPLWPDHYIIRAGATGQAGQAYRYDLITILSGPELSVRLVRLTAMTWSLYYQGRSYRSGWSGLPLSLPGAILSGPELPVRLVRLTAMTWSLYYQGRSYRPGWSGLPLWPDHYIIRAGATGQAGQAYRYDLITILSGPELPVRLVRLTAMTWSLYYQGRSYRSGWSGLPLWPDHYIIRAGATGQAGQAYRYDLITILSGPELPVRLVRLTAMTWSLYYQGRSYRSGWSGLPLWPDHYIIRAGATGQAGQAYRYDLITILSGPELPVRLVRLTAMTWSLYYQGRSYRSGWSGLPLWPDHYIIRAGATRQAGQAYRYDLITILSGPELPVRLVRLTAMTWSLYYQGRSYPSGWSGLPLWPDHYIIRAGATGQAGQAYHYDLITILSGPELPVRLVRLTAMTWSLYYQGRSYRSGWSGLPLWPDHYIIRAGATRQAGQAYRYDLITILSGPELPVRLVRLTAMTWSLYYQGRSYRSGWSGLPLWPDHYIIRAGATGQADQAYRYDLITILSGPELPVRLVRLTAMTWSLYYQGLSYRSGWSGLPLWPDHYIIRAEATGQAGQAYRYDLITILSGPELPVRLVRLTAMTWSLYYQGRSYPSGWSGLPLWPDHYIIRAGATGQAGQAYHYDLITILSGPELPVRLVRLTAMTWSLYYQGRSYRSGWSGLPLWPDHYIIRAGATRQAGQAYRYDLITILSGPELPVRLVRLTAMTWSLYYQGRSYRSGWSGLPLWPDHYIIRAGATGQADQAYRYDLITILSGPELPVRLVRLTAMTWSLYYQGRSYRSGWSGLPLWPDHYIIRAGATGHAGQAYRYDLITILSGPELPVRLVRLTAMTWSLYYQGRSYRSGWSG